MVTIVQMGKALGAEPHAVVTVAVVLDGAKESRMHWPDMPAGHGVLMPFHE